MLTTPCLSRRSFSLTAARSARCRARADMKRDRCPLATRTRVRPGLITDRPPVLTDGVTGAADGRGRDGILAALPTPAGSLTEPLSPFTLPGPDGIPLTPASCENDGMAGRTMSAAATRTALPLPPRKEFGIEEVMSRPESLPNDLRKETYDER
jgi:hypothetical protein